MFDANAVDGIGSDTATEAGSARAGTTAVEPTVSGAAADRLLPMVDEAWTPVDDELLAAITATEWEAMLAEPPDDRADGPPFPPELLFALLAGPQSAMPSANVAAMQAHARMVAYHQAMQLEAMMGVVDEYTRLADDDLELAMDGAASEVRAALSLTRRAADSDLDLAWILRDRLPVVMEALKHGRIDLRRAWVVARGTAHLDDDAARSVADRVLSQIDGRTTGQIRALIRRLCVEVDPGEADRRHQTALDERKVVAELGDDSTSTITASDLPPERVAAVMDRLTRIAQTLRVPGEQRTIDQLRADVFLDLLEGNTDGRVHGTLDIRVDIETLVGLENRTAELGGWGPVVADIARQMTQRFGPSWRFGVTDDSGTLVHTDITRRRPNAALRRLVESRDQTCSFPGCRAPAGTCDLDHRIQVVDGGTTHEDQLVPLCRHDHVIRHRFGWTHRRNPDGSHTWTSPLGIEYERPPPA